MQYPLEAQCVPDPRRNFFVTCEKNPVSLAQKQSRL